jgi:adenylate kinase family enzyme
MIVGCSGSGKSTLSARLSEVLNLPVIHLDKHYWRPNWVSTPDEEWHKIAQELIMEDKWIIDGNYSGTMDIRVKRADLIIYLDMPRWLCLYRVIKRRIMYNKKTRPDMHEGCPEKIDLEFLQWVWNFRRKNRENLLEKLEQVKKENEIIIVNRPKQVDEIISTLERSYHG